MRLTLLGLDDNLLEESDWILAYMMGGSFDRGRN